MPELPEVEVTRRSFAQAISGARVLSVELGKPLRWPLGCDPAVLVDRVVTGVRRRGKYLLLDFDEGLLLLHLGMSGSLRFMQERGRMGLHDHFEMVTSAGVLRLNDPRRFGAVVYAYSPSDPVVHRLLGKLGMEPLSADFRWDVFFFRVAFQPCAGQAGSVGGASGSGGRKYLCLGNLVLGWNPTHHGSRANWSHKGPSTV